jgi:hypothetical protein
MHNVFSMWTRAKTETMLANSGVPWTALRNGFYADVALRFMGTEWQQGRRTRTELLGKASATSKHRQTRRLAPRRQKIEIATWSGGSFLCWLSVVGCSEAHQLWVQQNT